MLALADCNNFFVSCERIFNPRLEGKPVIILSSNDGCAIARSAEAKALGVRMGEPWYRVKHHRKFSRVVALSSNFELYGDISARVMRVLARHSPRQEVYSVDECFLDLSHVPLAALAAAARAMQAEVLQWVGIPVSVGLAPTKTLAKLAAERAKQERIPVRLILDVLGDPAGAMSVREVWGVGPASAQKLVSKGIRTVADLAVFSLRTAQELGGAALARTTAEVQGTPCLALETEKRDPHQIMSSRSFGKPVHQLGTLSAAVREFAAKCITRMKKRSVAAQAVVVFVVARMSDGSRSSLSKGFSFTKPVSDPELLQAVCTRLVAHLFRQPHGYVKAGVMLLELQPTAFAQGSLFEDATTDIRMHLADTAAVLNLLDGGELDADTLERSNRVLALAGVQPASLLQEDWAPRAASKTLAFTTRWSELPSARTS